MRRLPALLIALALSAACDIGTEKPIRDVFVCTPSAKLLLTPRSGFKPLREIPNGERVSVLFEKDDWLKIRTSGGEEGWMQISEVAELDVLDKARALAAGAADQQVQYDAVLTEAANLRIAPDRHAPYPLRLEKDTIVAALEHHRTESDETGKRSPALHVKVRSKEGRAGWVAGWLVKAIVPRELEDIQEDRKLGACIVMNSVGVGGATIPQYVYADLMPDSPPAIDFDRIRVFTWNAKRKGYGTAYVERRLEGVLPITREDLPEGKVLVRVRQIGRDGGMAETEYVFAAPYFRKTTPAR